jgi:hypothetical protein
MLGSSSHDTESLLDTSAALGTTFAPTCPRFKSTINWAWMLIAFHLCCTRQAFPAPIGACDQATHQLLSTTTTLLRALLSFPFFFLAVNKEQAALFSISLHLVELASDFLEGTELRLEADVVLVAALHRRFEIFGQASKLLSGRPCLCSRIGFSCHGCCQLGLGFIKNLLVF